MRNAYEDLATALVSATLCLAAASLFVVVFASAVSSSTGAPRVHRLRARPERSPRRWRRP